MKEYEKSGIIIRIDNLERPINAPDVIFWRELEEIEQEKGTWLQIIQQEYYGRDKEQINLAFQRKHQILKYQQNLRKHLYKIELN